MSFTPVFVIRIFLIILWAVVIHLIVFKFIVLFTLFNNQLDTGHESKIILIFNNLASLSQLKLRHLN